MIAKLNNDEYEEEQYEKMSLDKKLQKEMKEILDKQLNEKKDKEIKKKNDDEYYYIQQQEMLKKLDEMENSNNKLLKEKIQKVKVAIEEMNKSI